MSAARRRAGRHLRARIANRGESPASLAQTRALRVLKEVAEALNRAPTEQRAAGEALRRMADLLGVETGWVWLLDPATHRFYSAAAEPAALPAGTGENDRPVLLVSRPLRARPAHGAQHRCRRVQPAGPGDQKARQASQTRGLRCHASVPLYAGDRPLGVMNLAMRGWRRLTRQELDLLTTIANQVGVAIERARLGEQSVQHARADERSRIARDVHDTLAQGFTAIALQIEAALSHLGRRDRARPSLQRALEVARQGVEETRQSIGTLRASPLENRPLVEALGVLSRRFTADTGVRVRLEVADVGALPADMESELFRIASEALSNVAKHAGAREVSLRLGTVRGRLRLTVADAGRGFRLRGARGRGFGLVGIEDRARLVGGRATITSALGRGTNDHGRSWKVERLERGEVEK